MRYVSCRINCSTPEKDDLSGALFDKHVSSLNHKLLLQSFNPDSKYLDIFYVYLLSMK